MNIAPEYTTQVLDHLGIVAGICQKIGLIEQIDEMTAETGRKVSVGQAVQAMVLNGLGFVSRPLYLTPEFYANKPVEMLIGAGVRAADLNDDSLGRALDQLYEAGVTEVFAKVSAHALHVFGIETRFAHLDSTAFSLTGEYETEAGTPDEDEPQPVSITYGYSKDHRPDLKQTVLGLICANRESIPVWLTALDGNRADKSSFPEIATAYLAQYSAEAETPYLVADSALFSASNLQKLDEVKWVTRVPATVTEAQQLLTFPHDQLQAADQAGYFYHEQRVTYAGIEQRWLLVLYEPNQQRELEQLTKTIEKERLQAEKELKKLARETFACREDAQQALARAGKTWKYHTLVGQCHPVTQYLQAGRPRPDTPSKTIWQLQATLVAQEAAITATQVPLGRYIIATNELDETRLSTAELLTVYKDQHHSVERGFRFLKDPLFFASRFFLKKPARIMGLLMVMGLSLLVYALAESTLRSQLQTQQLTLPDQRGKPTQTITMRRVFQMFEGIHLLRIQQTEFTQQLLLNLKDIHLQIAQLLGAEVHKFYVLQN
jgi:transposase